MADQTLGEHTAQAMLVIDADPEQIWRTFTQPPLVKEYLFGTTLTTDWAVGSDVTYSGEWNGEPYEDRGTVVEVREPLRLVTTFFSPSSGREDTPENRQTVTRHPPSMGWMRVTVTQDNNVTREAAEQSSASWQEILERVADIAPRA